MCVCFTINVWSFVFKESNIYLISDTFTQYNAQIIVFLISYLMRNNILGHPQIILNSFYFCLLNSWAQKSEDSGCLKCCKLLIVHPTTYLGAQKQNMPVEIMWQVSYENLWPN